MRGTLIPLDPLIPFSRKVVGYAPSLSALSARWAMARRESNHFCRGGLKVGREYGIIYASSESVD